MLIKNILFDREQENDEPIVDSFVIDLQILYKGEKFDEIIKWIYLESLQSFNDEQNILWEIYSDFDNMNDNYWLYTITHEEVAGMEEWCIHITIDFSFFDNSFQIEEIENFQNIVIEQINKNENILAMRKFRDDIQFFVYHTMYKDLYKTEIELRKVLSYIFLARYYINEYEDSPDFSNFLKDIIVNPSSPKYRNKDWFDEKNTENIFFYLLFSDYINLLQLKKFESTKKYKQLLEKLKEIRNDQDNRKIFDELDENYSFFERAEEFEMRGIVNESHKDFIASIKENMGTLESIRNAVMHFRNMDQRLILNYMKSLTSLNEKIEWFWENEKNFEEEDEFWLKVWEKYESLKDLPNFKKWEKYELKYWDKHDAIFIGEELEEVRFADKELLEYFKVWEE